MSIYVSPPSTITIDHFGLRFVPMSFWTLNADVMHTLGPAYIRDNRDLVVSLYSARLLNMQNYPRLPAELGSA